MIAQGALADARGRLMQWLDQLRDAHQSGGLDAHTLRLQRAHCYLDLGMLETQQGDGIAAEALLRKAAALFGTLGQDGPQAEAQKALGQLAAGSDRLPMAQRWFDAACKSFQQAKRPAEAGLMRLQALHMHGLSQTRKAAVAAVDALQAPVREAMILAIHAVEKQGSPDQRIHAQALAEHICRLIGDGEAMVWHMAQRLQLLEAENQTLREQRNEALEAQKSAPSIAASPAPAAPGPEREQDAMRSFIHKAAHDMKEPLRMIAGFGGLIQRRYAEALGQDGQEYLDTVLDAGKRMQELLEKLLLHASIGTEEAASGSIALSEVLNSLLQEKQSEWTAKGAEIQCSIQGQWPGSAAHWQAALQELIDNALRFNQSDHARVRIEGRTEGSECVLRISDNGIGIEPQYREAVFDLFRRLHARSEYRGSGIGLAIVSRVVERYGGHCRCTEAPGGGSCFELRIPRAVERLNGEQQPQQGPGPLPPAA
jgi:signal transduction histidine kinase